VVGEEIGGERKKGRGRKGRGERKKSSHAKNAKEKACDGFSVPSLEKISSATEFRPLRVLRAFA
jgi:hypothetical protein